MPKQEYDIGGKVKHKLFGNGKILNIDGQGDSAKLTIEFSGKISKMIIAKYVKHA